MLRAHPDALVFFAVPDDAVAAVAAAVAANDETIPKSVAFAHLSGALGLDALSSLSRRHQVGSFHPLRSFPVRQPPDAFRGIVIAVDASSATMRGRLEKLARDLGARPRIVADADRVLYHAAAVFASNYGVALLKEAASLLVQIGWTEREAVNGLLPLMIGALEQAGRRGPTAALTGPIRRGDVATVRRHLQVLRTEDSAIDLYRMLGTIALEIATEAGLDSVAADRVRRALTQKAAATRRRRRR
jgi:predicted short-subunit dehydrogenase-like oxidoreductase (DUF2520 family)